MKISRRFVKLVAVILCFLVMGIFIMPHSWKEKVPLEGVRNYLVARKANFGLDLVGGKQIDFAIDMSKVNELNRDNDPDNDRDPSGIVDSIAEILRRRIDPNATKELAIYPATYGDEHHVIVEITADLDNEATLVKLQKVIDLEFKEQSTEPPEAASAEELKKRADELLATVTAENFEGKAAALSGQENVTYTPDKKYWRDEADATFGEGAGEIWAAAPETLLPRVYERKSNTLVQGAGGNFEIQEVLGFVIVKIGAKETIDRTRTEPGEDFETVQSEVSEKPDLKTEKLLDVPEPFQSALLNLESGTVSDVLESDDTYAFFKVLAPQGEEVETSVQGIYVAKNTPDARAKVDAARQRLDSTTTTTKEEQLTVQEIVFAADASGWKETGLGGLQFKRARVGTDPNTGRPLVEILFNDEGAKMFEEITERNVGKPLAIFVGGELISAPNINEKISGGSAVITMGIPNYAEAQKEAIRLSQELNGGSTPAPFREAGQFKIGATLGINALSKSLQAGLWGLLALSIWMILLYRFLGFLAVAALGFYAVFMFFLLQANLSFSLSALIGSVVFVTTLRSFSSLEKNDLMSLFMALVLGILITFIAHSPIVLTLAGIAGIVLSMGMAVDANILIFERVKEEIRSGKNYSAAEAIGFERAWSSIRDSNLSSLITCMILWIFGSATIKGFAVALAMGIVISMLTAVTITRTLMENVITPRLAKKKGFLIASGRE